MPTYFGFYALRSRTVMRNSDLKIIHQDDEIVVVEKPSGLLSVPGRGPNNQDCVVNRLKKIIPFALAQPAVHRLDMATSGLMVLARTTAAHRHLSQQFAQRQVHKKYIAIISGCPKQQQGEIRLAFRLDPDNRPRQIYDPQQGKLGISRWRLIGQQGDNSSRIEFIPHTGRTHQLRLHAAHPLGLGHAIIGDALYGGAKQGDRLLLHATFLAFSHPLHGQKIEFSSPPPF